MTHHINAKQSDFSETVLFPGDPILAKYIADDYLKDAVQVCNVRNMLGYTGFYKGKKISIIGHGMGIPSISIYAYELIHEYNVKKLIRIGSCGGVADNVYVRDIVVATGAGTVSSTNRIRFAGYDYAAVPDFELLQSCWQTADSFDIPVRFGNVLTNDLFYDNDNDTNLLPTLKKMNILGVEKETAALFAIATENQVQALSILTVSDHIVSGEDTTAEERETTFIQMMDLALETALRD